MTLTGEGDEQGIATEPEHVSAVGVNDVDQPREGGVDRAQQQFRPRPSSHQQPLGEPRVAGNIGKDRRGLDPSDRRCIGGQGAAWARMAQRRDAQRQRTPPGPGRTWIGQSAPACR